MFKHPSNHLLLLNTLICASSQFCGGLVKNRLPVTLTHQPHKSFFLITWNVFCSCCFKSSLDLVVTKHQISILSYDSHTSKIRLQWTECTLLILSIVHCVGFVYVCVCMCVLLERPTERKLQRRDTAWIEIIQWMQHRVVTTLECDEPAKAF